MGRLGSKDGSWKTHDMGSCWQQDLMLLDPSGSRILQPNRIFNLQTVKIKRFNIVNNIMIIIIPLYVVLYVIFTTITFLFLISYLSLRIFDVCRTQLGVGS
jgi:hypothetical protein